jgi:tricorn protease
MKTYSFSPLLILLFLSFSLSAQNINKEDTRLLSKPAMSEDSNRLYLC